MQESREAQMELSDLQIFRTVVDESGVLKAARKLHRAPSSVSARIRQLEASIGVRLFYRDKQRLFLSPSGELLLGYADKLLRLSAEALAAVSSSPPGGLLRLGALESTAASRLPGILASYHRTCPGVQVELSTGTNDALTNAVCARQLDAAFVAEKPENKELSSLAMFSERLVIISSDSHRRIKSSRDVEGDTVIAFPNGCAYRRILQRWLGTRRIATLRVLELSSYHAIVACVASGTGIALVPESVLATLPESSITRHPLPKVYAEVTTPFIWRRAELSAALIALQSELRKHMQNRPH